MLNDKTSKFVIITPQFLLVANLFFLISRALKKKFLLVKWFIKNSESMFQMKDNLLYNQKLVKGIFFTGRGKTVLKGIKKR